jgi:hypothetical protein
MATIDIVPVENESQMRAFVDLPWKIYAGNENWVPPLKSHVRRLLDTSKHPYWKAAERTLFLAQQGGMTVGRIAGIVDSNYNQYHHEKMAVWGFFECLNDHEAAAALFGAVEQWAREKRMTALRGPMSPSFNYEIGILIEGFQYPPVIMMAYNPPYYLDLVESCGWEKEKDLLAFLVVRSDRFSQRMDRLVRRTSKGNRITIRPFKRKEIARQINLLRELYNDCLSDHWGFLPVTDEEASEMFSNLRWIGDPDLVFFVYYEDDPAGLAIVVPDINPLLKRLNGKIGLSGLIKILLYRHEITGLRGMVFGVRKKYRGIGLPLVALEYFNRQVRSKNYRYLELGWSVEDNKAMIQMEREGGAKAYKRYRIFHKAL